MGVSDWRVSDPYGTLRVDGKRVTMSIKANVYTAAIQAMEQRNDVPPKVIRHYRRLLAEAGTTIRYTVHDNSNDFWYERKAS